MKKTKRTTKFLTNLLIIVSILLLGTGLFADFTPLINYQGKLQENDVPVNETLNMEFKIYDSLTGGNLLWSSGVVSVSVNNGIFNYILGMNNGAAFALIDWSRDRWIEVDIDGETLAPREQLTGVPYSLMSRDLVLTNNKTIKNTWVTNGAQIKGTAILGTTLPGPHANSHSPGQSDALEANSIVSSNIVNSQVSNADIADGAITSSKIADGTIISTNLASDTNSMAKVSGGVVNISNGIMIIDGDLSINGTIGNYFNYIDNATYTSPLFNGSYVDITEYNTGINFSVPTGKTWYFLITSNIMIKYEYADRQGAMTSFYASISLKIRNGSGGAELSSIPLNFSGYRMNWSEIGANSYFYWNPSVSKILSLPSGNYNIYVAPNGYSDGTMNYVKCSKFNFQIKRIL